VAEPQGVRLPPLRYIAFKPESLPPADEIRDKLAHNPEFDQVRSGKLGNWFTTPLEGGTWTAWGVRAKPDAIGMTYMAINRVSAYPEPAETGFRRTLHSRYIKTNPAIGPEMEEVLAPKYGTPMELDRKFQVWIEGAAQLAEEALARQWRPTRTLRWEQRTALDPELERAFDQYLTYLMESQYFCSDVIGPWIGLIHYAFVEIKSYLAYELFDYNLHCNVLRKRVLSNGGGMGTQLDGLSAGVLEVCNEASHAFQGEVERDFNTAVFAIDVLFNGLVLEMLRLGEAGAKTRFDQELLRHMMQDNARHVAWGCRRIKYYLEHSPDREEAVVRLNRVADRIEPAQLENHLLNPKVIEPLAVLIGGGSAGFGRGLETIARFWPQIAAAYLARLDWIGLPRRDRCLIPSEAPF
jgi:hypothetical protein